MMQGHYYITTYKVDQIAPMGQHVLGRVVGELYRATRRFQSDQGSVGPESAHASRGRTRTLASLFEELD